MATIADRSVVMRGRFGAGRGERRGTRGGARGATASTPLERGQGPVRAREVAGFNAAPGPTGPIPAPTPCYAASNSESALGP